jgi:hypothetical protein
MTNHNIPELLEATRGANQGKVPAPTDGSITSFLFPTRRISTRAMSTSPTRRPASDSASPLAAYPSPGVSRSSDEAEDQAIPVTSNSRSRGDSSYSLRDSCRSAIRPFEAFASARVSVLRRPTATPRAVSPNPRQPVHLAAPLDAARGHFAEIRRPGLAWVLIRAPVCRPAHDIRSFAGRLLRSLSDPLGPLGEGVALRLDPTLCPPQATVAI